MIYNLLVLPSASTFSIVSNSKSACFFWKTSIGLNLTALSPHPPICTPLARIRLTNSSLRGLSHAMKVAMPLPLRFSISSGYFCCRRSSWLNKYVPTSAVCRTRSRRSISETMALKRRTRAESPTQVLYLQFVSKMLGD